MWITLMDSWSSLVVQVNLPNVDDDDIDMEDWLAENEDKYGFNRNSCSFMVTDDKPEVKVHEQH